MAKKKWIPKNLKKGRCTPAPNPDCPVGSPQYNLAMTFKRHASKGRIKTRSIKDIFGNGRKCTFRIRV
jgi:hypothetical protein